MQQGSLGSLDWKAWQNFARNIREKSIRRKALTGPDPGVVMPGVLDRVPSVWRIHTVLYFSGQWEGVDNGVAQFASALFEYWRSN